MNETGQHLTDPEQRRHVVDRRHFVDRRHVVDRITELHAEVAVVETTRVARGWRR